MKDENGMTALHMKPENNEQRSLLELLSGLFLLFILHLSNNVMEIILLGPSCKEGFFKFVQVSWSSSY